MTDCLECDASNGDAFKYANDINQLRDSVIGYGKEIFVSFLFAIMFVKIDRL